MEYRRLGRSGLKISTIALGNWLTYGGTVDFETGMACIRKAYDLGVNYFDTADSYGVEPGAGEEFMAEALREFPRHSCVLATKAFWPVGPGPNDRGLSRKHLVESVHRSLRRLRTEYLDIFYCHRHDPETPLDEVLGTLDDLCRQGKILYVGVSEWPAAPLAEACAQARRLGKYPFVVDQLQYSMLVRQAEAEVLPLCQEEGIGAVAFLTLAHGVLTGKYRLGRKPPEGSRGAHPSLGRFVSKVLTEDNLQRVERLTQVAQRLDISLAQLAVAWALHQPGITCALLGASRPQQVEENVRAAEVRLSAADLAEIAAILPGVTGAEA